MQKRQTPSKTPPISGDSSNPRKGHNCQMFWLGKSIAHSFGSKLKAIPTEQQYSPETKRLQKPAELFLLLLAATFLSVFSLSAAHASLNASPVILAFKEGGTTRRDITVSNAGLRTQYVEVTALRIENPGQHPEKLTSDPDPSQLGLLVAPRRITLKPGEQKIIRVIRLQVAVAQDEAWRVHIKPVFGEVEASSSGVMLNLAYKALVYVRPENAQVRLQGQRSGKKLSINNLGNTNALLHGGEQCAPSGSPCQKISPKRLWPGDTWETDLPYATPVSFLSRDAKGDETVKF